MRVRSALLVALLTAAAPANAIDPQALWDSWPQSRFVDVPAPCLKPAALRAEIDRLQRAHPELEVAEVGRSVEGRPIHRITVGRGDREVLLWSQMHGDEPSATPALLDLAHYLLTHAGEPGIDRLLATLTLRIVPMLNPDGAEAYSRRNAQGIDINRDALNLATPEGRLLKRLRDEHLPILGFNLHDQMRRRTVGDTGVLATVSVLAVVGDAAKTVTPGRRLSLAVSTAIADMLQAFIPGGVGRFDDTFSPRAFGDNLTAWGTPVVLIESGGVAPGQSLAELTRLNFVALVASLVELSEDGLARRDPEDYEAIPENNSDVWSDVLVRGGRILQPGGSEPFRADLAFDRLRGDRESAKCETAGLPRSEITELGDARIFAAGEIHDATGKVLLPSFTVGVDGWRARSRLGGAELDRLARLGVARIVWAVGQRDVGAALALSAALRAAGRPKIEVTAERAALPELVLARAVRIPAEPTLGAAIEALERAARARAAPSLSARLERLWGGRAAALRFEGVASFQLIDSTGDLEDLAEAPISAVSLDGHDLSEVGR